MTDKKTVRSPPTGVEKNMNDSCNCSGYRGFLTSEEKIDMLKEYKKNLDLESKGVSERIKELEKKHAEN
jgi:hypothetical protein